ncbi:hypothetical protein [Yersinia mollaretii]|uniref:hypothetical protein n=1 Tax=Yersinia mollaretii TaxID=33060 RepID=UPI00061B933F|nr:hypothetical protein [Yersinia mollaretii]CNJ52357.1 Uncharacterised protein [Yersinia mollaretii]
MKALDSFTVERLGEIKNAFLDCNKETAPSIGEIFTLIDIALAAKRAEPVSLESAIEKFKEYNIGFPVEKLKADFVISWCLTNLTPQLNSPEIPDGWKLVPIEPTLAMLTLLGLTGSFESMLERYANMLDAAPERENG